MAGLVETSPDRPPGIVDATVAAIAGRHRADRDRHAWPPALHAHQARQVRAFTLLSGARACPERTAAPFCLAVGRKPVRSGAPERALPECHRGAERRPRAARTGSRRPARLVRVSATASGRP